MSNILSRFCVALCLSLDNAMNHVEQGFLIKCLDAKFKLT